MEFGGNSIFKFVLHNRMSIGTKQLMLLTDYVCNLNATRYLYSEINTNDNQGVINLNIDSQEVYLCKHPGCRLQCRISE